MAKVYKNWSGIYKDEYLMDSLQHMENDPREMEAKERDGVAKKYFETIV